MTDISCFGLGLMGSALARAFLAAGRQVTLWNRTPGRAAALVAQGGQAARDLAQALRASPTLVFCIADYAAVRALLQAEGAPGRFDGQTLVNLTTGTPREADDLSAWVAARGGRYLDGAILCGPEQMGTGAGEVLVSGDTAAWADLGETLSALAGKVRFVGPGAGQAAALDFAWLIVEYVQFIGVAHAAAICRAEGIDLQELMALFPIAPGHPDADIDQHPGNLARIIKEEDYHRPSATLQVWAAALAHIQAQARDAGIPPDIPDFIAGYFQRALAMGLGQQEAIAIFKTLGVQRRPRR